MRWLGAARRAHHIATAYAAEPMAFGQPLAAHEGVGFMLADNEMDIRTARLQIWHTALLLDQGERASMESSIAKPICAEAVWSVELGAAAGRERECQYVWCSVGAD